MQNLINVDSKRQIHQLLIKLQKFHGLQYCNKYGPQKMTEQWAKMSIAVWALL
jgi:hypothetical protein